MKAKKRQCRICGCTDEDCSRCIEKTGYACSWVEPDLCSACIDVLDSVALNRIAKYINLAELARESGLYERKLAVMISRYKKSAKNTVLSAKESERIRIALINLKNKIYNVINPNSLMEGR